MVVVNQFFISQGSKSGDTLILTPEESHHLRDVQRHKANETIQVTDGKKSFFAQIMTLTKYEVIIRLMSEVITPEKKGSITLAQALLKGDGMEWVLEKSVELGVDFIQPFTSKRTIVESESPNKRQRWEKIMDAAVKQCGTPTRPILKTTLPFEKVLENSSELKIIFWEEGGISLKDFFKEKPIYPTTHITALIGPEGGFSKEEAALAQEKGFVRIFLGHRILRAETAAITAASLIQYELGNL